MQLVFVLIITIRIVSLTVLPAVGRNRDMLAARSPGCPSHTPRDRDGFSSCSSMCPELTLIHHPHFACPGLAKNKVIQT